MARRSTSAVPDKLTELLQKVLPDDPEQAVKGTELIALLRREGLTEDEWLDESLRSRFSTLAHQETSVIAKRVGRHGYYRRPAPDASEAKASSRSTSSSSDGRNGQREEKFRSVFMAWLARESEFPVHIEHVAAARRTAGLNSWKFPDVVSVRWDVLSEDEKGRQTLDSAILDVRRSLGEQPFQISSTELKVSVRSSTLREVFFQCLSNSKWAHSAQLVIATDIADEAVANELRRLGASYGVSVTSFLLTEEELDKLPAANQIRDADTIEQALGRQLETRSFVTSREKDFLDWEHIKDMQSQHEDFERIFRWIAKCIGDSRPHTFQNWKKDFG